MRFVKGHGTGNDFVLLADPDGRLDLTPALVRRVCDRRTGVGADGVLRVVRSEAHPEAAELAGDATWFMDYRNADGSVAEMCGNGSRVFARYLVDAGLAPAGEVPIATRAGVKLARLERQGDVVVSMGVADLPSTVPVTVRVGDRSWPGTPVCMPNPHAVALVDDLGHAGSLLSAPVVEPAGAFPHGVNVEFVVVRAPGEAAMRVHERGVGETCSCGTGACAAVVAARRAHPGSPRTWAVDVPGGRLSVTEHVDGSTDLGGPAVLVAEGELRDEWLTAS